jgi:hypothetical protein
VAHLVPLATRCSHGAKRPSPLLQGSLPRDGSRPLDSWSGRLEPARRSFIRAWRLAVDRAGSQGPPTDQEKFPQTLHDTRPELLNTQLCPNPDP